MGCSALCKPKSSDVRIPLFTVKPIDDLTQISNLRITQRSFISYNDQPFKNVYKLLSILGKGAFADVKVCIHRISGVRRAVKVMRRSLIESEELEEQLKSEIDILSQCDHPNIVKVYEFFEDKYNFYIVMEYCSGGELFDELVERRIFTENQAALVMSQVLSALNYMHSKGIIHRDMKPENILLEERGDISHVKLIDFGLAITKSKNQALGACGTCYYVAPEVVEKSYNEKCDL